jgi:hypothetical protein
MNVRTVVASVLLAGICARAAAPAPGPQRTVAICMGSGNTMPFLVTRAQATATQMFAAIGVQTEWHPSERYCKTRWESIIVRLSENTPPTRVPGALAYARPYDGAPIEVFYDRIMAAEPRRVPTLLAHVLAHEVAHILQGVNRHSEEGIMKARWNEGDHREMSWKPLPFTSEDVELIQRGLDARALRLAKRN